MIKLYLVRHGETDGNIKKRYQGSTDVPLNENGLVQAHMLSDYLKDTPFTAIYSSPLCRAKVTADLIAAPHHLDVQTCEDLKEINFGVWEGHTYDEITTLWPGEMEAFYNSDGTLAAREGESFAHVRDRMTQAVHKLMANHKDGDTVLVVSHGASLRSLLFGLLDLPLRHIWCFEQYNTALSIINYYGDDNTLELLNSTVHLKGMSGDAGTYHA